MEPREAALFAFVLALAAGLGAAALTSSIGWALAAFATVLVLVFGGAMVLATVGNRRGQSERGRGRRCGGRLTR